MSSERDRPAPLDLAAAWATHADDWVRWARAPEPDVPEHAIREPRRRRWQRIPLFLHLRAVKPATRS